MDSLSINDLLPAGLRIKKIVTGSELLLAYELNKYAELLLGKKISLADILILKSVKGSEQFSFVVTNNLNVGAVPERESLVDYSDTESLFFTGTVDGIEFKSKSVDTWVYDFSHNIKANMVLHGANRSAAYVSLVAYMMVKAKKDGVDCPKLIIDHEGYKQLELEYVDLLILQNYGNRLIKDLVEIRYKTKDEQQPEWEAFVMYNRQRGAMNREYRVVEKYRYLKKNFQPGDVVLYYQRRKGAAGRTINKLLKCYPAVIKGFNNVSVSLTYYPLVQTKVTRHIALSSIEEDYEGKVVYTGEDYDRFPICGLNSDLMYIGVDLCTFDEVNFFIRPVDFDGSKQYFKTKDGYERVFLPTLDTIYAVFEDRNVQYNKDRFLKMYFKNKVPVYERYKSML